MKNRKTGKWILVLVMMFLLNALCLTSVVYAKEINTHDSLVLTSIKNQKSVTKTALVKKKNSKAKAPKATQASKESTFSPIKKGATGDSVVEIQKRLVELGYLTSADGSYGPGTEQAIKNFQAANDLSTDGVVNENTYNKIFSSEAKRYVAPTPTEVPEQSYTRAAAESPQERLVWITKTGKRYHSRSNCGSTKTAWQVTLEEAERKGLTRCGKCW
jgi:peptidoglycan hydrolase-like protein with peptidoglycan-binding domain